MICTTTCSEANQRIQQVILSLQHLSQRVLPDMKQVSGDMLSGESARAASSHEALMLETHQVIGAALKELGSIVMSHRLENDANEITQPTAVANVGVQKQLSPDVEMESLRFCARVDLDKLQLVSNAKRAFVDEASDRLALHKIFLVNARHDVSKCRIIYLIQHPYSGDRSLAQDAFTTEQEYDPKEQVPLQASPFRRMRNAFIGAMHFNHAQSMSATFKALISEFLRQQKGALQVGKIRLRSLSSEQSFNYLFALATDDLHAECLVLDAYRPVLPTLLAAARYAIEAVLSAESIRRRVKRIVVKAYSTRMLEGGHISALADLATNSGDIRRIDVVLDNVGVFADCLPKWIKAITSQKAVTHLVDNVLFHCRCDASMPEALGAPKARLPKRKWSTTMYTGHTLEFEDVHEKAVYVFEDPDVPKKITAVFARYQSNAADSRAIVTCNFFSNASSARPIDACILLDFVNSTQLLSEYVLAWLTNSSFSISVLIKKAKSLC